MNSDLLAVLTAGAADSPALRASSSSAAPVASSSPFVGGGNPKSVDRSFFSLDPAQWGPSLVLIQDHMAICGGCVGPKRNNTFCVALLDDGTSKGCGVSKHALLKHPEVTSVDALNSRRVYMHKGSGKNVAYAEPWLDASMLSPKELTMMLAKKYTSWEEWNSDALIFQAAAASNQRVDRVQTAVKATKIVSRFDGEGKNLFGIKEELGEGDDLGSKIKFLKFSVEELLKVETVEWWGKTDEEMSENERKFKLLVEKVGLLEKALVTLNEVSVDGLQELQLGVAVRLASLETVIGSLAALDEQLGFEGTTVAAAIEQLQAQLEELRSKVDLKSIVTDVMRSEEMGNFSDGLTEAFRKVMRRIINLESGVQELQASSRAAVDSNVASVASMGIIRDWLGNTEQLDESRSEMMKEPDNNMETEIKEMLTSLAKRVDAMEKNGGMNSKLEGEDISVFFMGVRFSSERDVSSYVRSKSNAAFVLPVGLITDCYSIFYELNREIFDSKNKLGVTDLAKVAQLAKRQADVYNILAGVEHGLPDFFDPPSSASKIYIDGKHGKKHRFGNIPTYEVWGPVGADGFTIRKKATGVLTRLVTTRKSEIKEQVKHEKLQSFLLTMLDMSKDFVTAVFSFLTEEYAALSQHFDDGALCWDFACSCVEHVFKHEFETARAVVRNPDVVDDAISAKIMWQSLRTIAVQETFMRVGFKNHPSLSSAYSKFLLTQYQKTASDLGRVSKELEVCKKICSDMAATVEAVEKRLRAAEGTANAAQNAIQRMKRGGD